MTARKSTKAARKLKPKGMGSLEAHGRTYRAHYFKLDPSSPCGFVRVTEGTGILVDGSDQDDCDPLTGEPDPKRARVRAELWLERMSAPYREFIQHGRFVSDAAKLARVARGELAKTEGEREAAARDLAEAEDKLPAYTLEAAWAAFDGDLASRKRDPATHRNYGQWYHLFTAWIEATHPEATELRSVTTPIAREYAKVLLERVRGTTYNRHLNALALIWATLAARDPDGRPVYPEARLGGNPFAYDKATKSGIPRVKLEKEDRPHRRRDLKLEEVAALLRTATGEMRVLLALGFYTGLRLGDCALLTFAKIDRVMGTISTRSKKTDTETETAIHPTLARIMEAEVKARSGYVLPTLAALYNGGTTGRVELVRRITEVFKLCGIETSHKENGDKCARPEAGFHSLRHSYATQLERARVALEDRRRLMGHASTAMTMHYTHAEAGAALALPNVLELGEDTAMAVADAPSGNVPPANANAPWGILDTIRDNLTATDTDTLEAAVKLIQDELAKRRQSR